MDSTFLKIGTRIVEVQWRSEFSYVPDEYKKWLEIIHLKSCEDLSDEEKKQIDKLEAVSNQVMYFPSQIRITETCPLDSTQVASTTILYAGDLEKINKHIQENKKSEQMPAKEMYKKLSELEIYN